MSKKIRLFVRAGRWLPALVLVVTVTACDNDVFESDNNAEPTPPTAQTAAGPVQGVEEASMLAFRGIPYAAPPVNDLRFAPPQPVEPRAGMFDASSFASACPQPPGVFSNTNISEDCLYLNVYTPKAEGSYPVMVWIHGGALETGSSNVYNPAPMVQQDVIVVTINYRLGILGFLAHPALSATSEAGASGNYGLMDQQAALEWVQANIANFGGNPDNVTIFGESAGALSVLSQLVRPPAAGLFDKAIVQSGSYSRTQQTLAPAEASGADFVAANLDCTVAEGASCLRALPVSEIIAAQSNNIEFVPNRRPENYPNTIATALRTGDFNQVPVIEGTNADEWRLFVGLPIALGAAEPLAPASYEAAIQATLGVPAGAAQAIAAEYPLSVYDSPDLALSALGTDAIFACNGRIQVQSLSQYVTTYAYEFADQDAPPIVPTAEGFDYGAAHAFEIQYVFGPAPGEDRGFTADQLQLAQTMTQYWTRFAKTGNPNPSSGAVTFWPKYDSGAKYLQLVPPSPQTITDFGARHHCAFWAGLS